MFALAGLEILTTVSPTFPWFAHFPHFSLTTLQIPDFSRFSRWPVTLYRDEGYHTPQRSVNEETSPFLRPLSTDTRVCDARPVRCQTCSYLLKGKGKEEYLFSAFLHQGTHKALMHGSHSFTCKQHHACLSFVAFTRCHHHSNWGSRHPVAAQYSFIDLENLT